MGDEKFLVSPHSPLQMSQQKNGAYFPAGLGFCGYDPGCGCGGEGFENAKGKTNERLPRYNSVYTWRNGATLFTSEISLALRTSSGIMRAVCLWRWALPFLTWFSRVACPGHRAKFYRLNFQAQVNVAKYFKIIANHQVNSFIIVISETYYQLKKIILFP